MRTSAWPTPAKALPMTRQPTEPEAHRWHDWHDRR
eukprot:CAMPEP_0202037060 /NCGR_PEP_ID=MMETSP0962-20130828/1936_1 /ASSEMBLY_ACC=CAM_ASM_000488 /TAXON_ID=4773 /ORGANISM="Schizochytrium aggregatum, Strain ATCC28209" /LENGTH=34 /DNA_ID= /DNA_START= /DNA_END= /DNA_ORIENTATION=